MAPRNTVSKQFRVAAQKKSVTLGHAVYILRQWRLSRTWTRLSAGTSISEMKPIRQCTDSCRSPFFVAETLIGRPDSALSWQSLSCFRLRQHSGSYHFTIQTFVCSLFVPRHYGPLAKFFSTQYRVAVGIALRDSALELGLPQSPQPSASSRLRVEWDQLQDTCLLFQVSWAGISRHMTVLCCPPGGSTVDRQASVNSGARYS